MIPFELGKEAKEIEQMADTYADFLIQQANNMTPTQRLGFMFHLTFVLLHQTFHVLRNSFIPRSEAVKITKILFQEGINCAYGKNETKPDH